MTKLKTIDNILVHELLEIEINAPYLPDDPILERYSDIVKELRIQGIVIDDDLPGIWKFADVKLQGEFNATIIICREENYDT